MAEKKIGGRFFKAGDARATDALKLQIRLLKVLGPAVDKLPVIFSARASGDENASNAAAIAALGAIVEKLDADEFISLVEFIMTFATISYDGRGNWDDITFDQEFSGQNMKDIIPVCVYIVQETLGDFFSGLQASGNLRVPAKG